MFTNQVNLQVEVSYAGPGGFLSRSLDIPRMINSLTLFLHFGTNIREASTTPLIFPFLDDHSDYFEGFTWVRSFLLQFKMNEALHIFILWWVKIMWGVMRGVQMRLCSILKPADLIVDCDELLWPWHESTDIGEGWFEFNVRCVALRWRLTVH